MIFDHIPLQQSNQVTHILDPEQVHLDPNLMFSYQLVNFKGKILHLRKMTIFVHPGPIPQGESFPFHQLASWTIGI